MFVENNIILETLPVSDRAKEFSLRLRFGCDAITMTFIKKQLVIAMFSIIFTESQKQDKLQPHF